MGILGRGGWEIAHDNHVRMTIVSDCRLQDRGRITSLLQVIQFVVLSLEALGN